MTEKRTDVVAIFAGGLSMTREIAERVIDAGIYSIAINNSWLLALDADALLACDAEWWQTYPEALEFGGLKIVMQDQRIPGATYVKPRPIGAGSNGALQATYVASDFGARKVLLFGVDLRDDELTHHHGLHLGQLHNPNPAVFRRQRKAWESFARETDRPQVINCNTRSALRCFPKMTTEDALCLTPTL